MMQHFEILGTGSDLPGKAIDAATIEQRANLPRGWVAKHTAVKTRYECRPPETLSIMAKRAIERALINARISWKEIDLILDCSTSRHQPIPCNAARIQSLFGGDAAGIPGFDINATCLGFLLALNIANLMCASNQFQTILIVAAEATLKAVNWKHPESASLFGDGAAAMLVRHSPQREGFAFLHQTFAEHYAD